MRQLLEEAELESAKGCCILELKLSTDVLLKCLWENQYNKTITKTHSSGTKFVDNKVFMLTFLPLNR